MTAPGKICSRTSQFWAVGLTLAASFFPAHAVASVRVIVDQVGYEPQATKLAVAVSTEGEQAPGNFSLVDADSGKTVLNGRLSSAGEVYNWRGMRFWSADFSAWHEPGRYLVRIGGADRQVESSPFTIQSDVLERLTLSNVLYYFIVSA